MAAATTALSTTELLEKMLLQLSIVDLIIAKRVSTLWHNCIQGSTQLRRKLFQEPIPASEAPEVRKYSRYSAQPVVVNPLLQNVFRIRHSEISGSLIAIVPVKGRNRLQQGRVTESVLRKTVKSRVLDGLDERPIVLDSAKFYKRKRARTSYFPGSDIPYAINIRLEDRNQAPIYSLESWASLLATQPPLKTLNLRCDSMGDRQGGIKVQAADEIGVTLGDVVKAAAEFYRKSGQKREDGFRFDVEMSIFQALGVERSKNGSLLYFSDGLLKRADEDEEVGFQRAWKTKLRCNLG